jgi:hypothetical protein
MEGKDEKREVSMDYRHDRGAGECDISRLLNTGCPDARITYRLGQRTHGFGERVRRARQAR